MKTRLPPDCTWRGAEGLPPLQYYCGHCGALVGPDKGYRPHNVHKVYIYICSYCMEPTYFNVDCQVPGAPYGNEVTGVPADVGALYRQARDCVTVSAHTGTVLLCRKLLAHIAVAQGAEEGKTFMQYVEYLADNNYIPPHGKAWVDHIRNKGNEANHEIKVMGSKDAEDLITFIEMLLKFIYEFPSKVDTKAGK